MKIYFVIKALDNPAGTERVTIVLSNALVERGHEVGIVSLEGNCHPFTPVNDKVHLHYLIPGKDRLFFPFKDARRLRLLRSVFQQEQPDVIVLVDAARMMTKMPACEGYPTIAWEHFNTSISTRYTHHLSRQYMARHASAVVTLTQADATVYQTRFQAHNALCIPNPITLSQEALTSPTEKSSQQKSSKTVLAVGRYSQQKGFDLLLQAWSQIADKKNWKLQIVGKGKLETSLRNLSKNLQVQDSVAFLPPTPHIVELYKKSSLFALSSRFEGLPLVLIEAGAMGLPAVSFDCKTGPSDIIVDGQTGKLVPDGNVQAFAKALDELMHQDDLRQQMAKQAQEHIRKTFSIEPIVKRWENLFTSVVHP